MRVLVVLENLLAVEIITHSYANTFCAF
jgi:hypothetical protein